MNLHDYIRDVPDFPKPGILFKDITPLLGDPRAFRTTVDHFIARYSAERVKPDCVVGIESRGFLFASAVAYGLQCAVVPARKPGKLPYKSISESYDLEYGSNTLEMHEDAIRSDQKVIVLDDVMATGGTLAATCRLVDRLGGQVVEVATVIELTFLNGRSQLGSRPYHSLISY